MRALGACVLCVTTACGSTAFVGVGTDGGLDAAAGNGGASDAAREGGACPGLPNIAVNCNNDNDCLSGPQKLDCCGSLLYVGYNQTSDFKTAENNLEAACGSCHCVAQSMTTQDGEVVTDPTKVKVRCEGQVCRTFQN